MLRCHFQSLSLTRPRLIDAFMNYFVASKLLGPWATLYIRLCFHFQADPFLRRVDGGGDGEEFEGFIPDLMKNLSQTLDFDYEISLVRDGKYGRRLADGTWNGMIGELLRGVSRRKKRSYRAFHLI